MYQEPRTAGRARGPRVLGLQIDPEARADAWAGDLVHARLDARHAELARRVGACRVDQPTVRPEQDALAGKDVCAGPEQRERQTDGIALGDECGADLGLGGT